MIRGLNQLTPQLALWNSRDVEVKILKVAGETIVPCPGVGFGSGPFAGKGVEPVTFPLKTKVDAYRLYQRVTWAFLVLIYQQ